MEHQAITSIYEKIKTPYKIGPVLKFDDYLCDSPSVFRYEDAWYMSYIKIHKNVKDSGYESHLAKSTDLIHWEELFPIFERSEDDRWDSKQRACYAGFVDNRLDSYFEIEKIDNRYYFSYLGGNLNGYETDPLMMGEMEVEHILTPKSYHPFEKPVLSPFDKDARFGEDLTIYKGHFFKDSKKHFRIPLFVCLQCKRERANRTHLFCRLF